MSQLIQYVVVRGDLLKVQNWPLGALIAQCCHAATAVNHLFRDDPTTMKYFEDLDNMHKVVLEAPDEQSLTKLAQTLTENDIKHKLWVEQPENYPTCIALKPYEKENVQKFVKKFKLFK
ncbi:putative peptidyl-tRNA hydrolase PTRHD1 [Culicoides brevitarsis]|uniref:putative peptidyl-tRNA hydrolase PTRHD1 n=1 Tax=Culicoides brevitarsis TaxID=469753 RepID=UPI00307BD4BE